MRSFHIKSVILGIGIGIVLTSFISLIYVAGTSPEKKMGRNEILEEARKYGMVDSTELFNKSTPSPGKTETVKAREETTVLIYKDDTPQKISSRLFGSGLIKDRKKFEKELETHLKKKSAIRPGEYIFKKEIKQEEIIKAILNQG